MRAENFNIVTDALRAGQVPIAPRACQRCTVCDLGRNDVGSVGPLGLYLVLLRHKAQRRCLDSAR